MGEFKYLWSVATGNVNPFWKKSRSAAKFLQEQPGFVAVHPADGRGILWLYDSENNAKGARNMARTKGIVCGRNICRFKWDGGSTIIFDDPNYPGDEYV